MLLLFLKFYRNLGKIADGQIVELQGGVGHADGEQEDADFVIYIFSFSSGQPSAVQEIGRWMSRAAPFCMAL